MSGTHEFIEDERNKDVLIYVNGELVPRNEAKVSVFDSAFVSEIDGRLIDNGQMGL